MTEDLTEDDDWLYPESMVERIKYVDEEIIVLYFPNPMTTEEIKEYNESILNESLGYKLLYEGKDIN